MATWTTIPNTVLETGKPIRAVDGRALRDNPIAIAEGASGAPKIRTTALQPPAAGTAYLICRLQDEYATTTAIVYPGVKLHNRHSSSGHLGVTCLVPGTITASFEQIRISGTVYARVLKNGVQVAEWSSTAGTTARSVNISVAIGDQIVFQQKTGGSGECAWQNLRIYSNNPDFAVA